MTSAALSSNPSLRSAGLPFFPGLLPGSNEILDVERIANPAQAVQTRIFVTERTQAPRGNLESRAHIALAHRGRESSGPGTCTSALGSQLPALSPRPGLAPPESPAAVRDPGRWDIAVNEPGLRVPLFPPLQRQGALSCAPRGLEPLR